MKKLLGFLLSVTLTFCLVACGNSNNSATSSAEKQNTNTTEVSKSSENTLVVYFSMPETTEPNNMTEEEDNSVVVIDGEVLGNTQYVAYVIQENTEADIFRIEPETPYPTDHDTLVDLAAEEQDDWSGGSSDWSPRRGLCLYGMSVL